MISAIKEKLNSFFKDKKDLHECDVVYLLVQLSKYYEKENLKHSIPCIQFFRNWAVHGSLGGESQYLNKLLQRSRSHCDSIPFVLMFNDLLNEIKSSGLVAIPDNLLNLFRDNLFSVIKDTPVAISIIKVELVAHDDLQIDVNSLA